ncbi:MAG: DUF502 domain-containing protein [Candidatus Omnitrophica bacterium]|nr:DUF502 domain-containing protein [Candidatus Omnitrophota bacterium]
METLIRKLRNNFISGLIILFPLVISFLFIRFLYFKLDQIILEPGIKYLFKFFPYTYLVPLFKIFIFILVILIISLLGIATKNIFGRRFLFSLEHFLSRLPLIGKIYSGTKEISDALLLSKKGAFRKVVLVEFPKDGSYALGFITSETKGEIQKSTKEEVVSVFIPTTPNPTSGFLLFVPINKTIPLDISVEEGIKLVISFGIVSR